jgi:glycine/D-amino acid oxidase-like deaminating enzyme
MSAPVVVNAAGPWCRQLTASAGLSLPWTLSPTRVQIVCVDRHPDIPGHIPVSVDFAGGIYFRTQNRGQQLVIGSTLERDEQETVDDPDQFNRLVDDEFTAARLHALQHRIPSFAYEGNITGYCGLYTVNRDDVHPLVGPTAVDGLLLANGFSGHGFKLAPAIGALLSRMISGERSEFDTDVPAEFLAVERAPISLDQKNVLA